MKFYKCDPHDFPGTEQQKNLVYVSKGLSTNLKLQHFFVQGGEACMWAEVVDDINIMQRIFPRACATAEKLWSQPTVNNVDDAMKRLEEHYCRLRLRNISAQPPNGPGLCL